MMAKYDQSNPQALKKLLAGGTKLHAFSPAIMQACLKGGEGIAQRNRCGDQCGFQEGLKDAVNGFTNNGYQWFQVAELGFDSFMARHSQG